MWEGVEGIGKGDEDEDVIEGKDKMRGEDERMGWERKGIKKIKEI